MQEPPREALIQRLSRFPSLIRGEQFRAWLILGSVAAAGAVIWFVIVFVLSGVFDRIVAYLMPNLRAGLRSLIATFGLLATLFFIYKVFGSIFHDAFGALSDFLGFKRNPFHVRGVTRVVATLRNRAPFGLYLRAFYDEDVLVPTSRTELSEALAALDIPFITVENSRTSASPQGLLVLSVPNSQWKATVFELMDLAEVIVIDVNVGFLHWMDELPETMSAFELDREVDRRLGMVNELEEIRVRGLEGKTVVLAPPGWWEMIQRGEIMQQIKREEEEALKRHANILAARNESRAATELSDVEWFSRTRLKRALTRLLRVTVSVEEVIRHVQEVILISRCR